LRLRQRIGERGSGAVDITIDNVKFYDS
jgi:hypothetical protein